MVKIENAKGFTLIELLVVLAIITILIGLAVAGIGITQRAQRDTTRKDLAASVNSLLLQYRSSHGFFPDVNTQFACNNDGSDFNCFVAYAANCPPNQLMINGTCEGLQGLVLNSAGYIPNCDAYMSTPINAFNVCYTSQKGTLGYQFGVFLESGSIYMIAQ